MCQGLETLFDILVCIGRCIKGDCPDDEPAVHPNSCRYAQRNMPLSGAFRVCLRSLLIHMLLLSREFCAAQFDIHSPGATVHEALLFSSELRLIDVSRPKMRQFVDEVWSTLCPRLTPLGDFFVP